MQNTINPYRPQTISSCFININLTSTMMRGPNSQPAAVQREELLPINKQFSLHETKESSSWIVLVSCFIWKWTITNFNIFYHSKIILYCTEQKKLSTKYLSRCKNCKLIIPQSKSPCKSKLMPKNQKQYTFHTNYWQLLKTLPSLSQI